MKIIYIAFIITIIAFAGLISIESDNRAYMLRDCINKTKSNADGLTVDREDIDLCIRAYDRRTSRNHELQKTVKRPAIDSKTQEL